MRNRPPPRPVSAPIPKDHWSLAPVVGFGSPRPATPHQHHHCRRPARATLSTACWNTPRVGSGACCSRVPTLPPGRGGKRGGGGSESACSITAVRCNSANQSVNLIHLILTVAVGEYLVFRCARR